VLTALLIVTGLIVTGHIGTGLIGTGPIASVLIVRGPIVAAINAGLRTHSTVVG
jgi:hypothetical protein